MDTSTPKQNAVPPVEVAGGMATDEGVVREHNEDAVALWDPSAAHLDTNGRLFALADGMGGHSRGEVASTTALQILFDRFYGDAVDDVALALKQALRSANKRLYEEGAARGPGQMMGTTLVAGVIRRNLLILANVGDSRAYILRKGQATQISKDHSVVAEQVEAGIITAEEARTSRNRNVITRALGHQPNIEVDIFEVPLLPRDGVALVSDGLYHALSDQELAEMALAEEPAAAAARLVATARQRESSDNASAIVVHYGRGPARVAAVGQDLFDTDQLPTPATAGRRGAPVGLLIAAAVLVIVTIAVIVLLVLNPGLLTVIGG
jgi:PPM family protein phosphatase